MSKQAAGKASKLVGGATGAASGIKGKVRLLVSSGEAKPGPSIGQALGPLGLNMAEFCKQFNAETSTMKPGIPTPVKLTAYKDRTFSFQKKTPPSSWFLKQCAGVDKGASKPGLETAGTVSLKQVYEIALIKQTEPQLADVPIMSICRMVLGSARSMGIQVVEGKSEAPLTKAT